MNAESAQSSNGEDFNFDEDENTDNVREKIEIMAIKMDIHKNGLLYLNELVYLITA